jgi:hypothetical protein
MGPILVAVFVFIESRVPNPLMPLRIWKIPQFGKLLFCYGVGFEGFWGGILYGYSVFYGEIYRANPVEVGACRTDLTHVGDTVSDTHDCGGIIDKRGFRVRSSYCSWTYLDGTGFAMPCYRCIARSAAAPGSDILGHVVSSNG